MMIRLKLLKPILPVTGLLCVAAVLAPADGILPTQLRLSWSSDPTTSMTVAWQTARPAASVVEFGTSEKLGRSVEGKRVAYAYETGTIHEATMKGLQPGTRYFYRAGDPDSGFSTISSFRTAPLEHGDFVFTGFGDHGVGDMSALNVERVLEEEPAFHLIFGDLSYANGRQSVWDDWFVQLERLARTVPVMPALGNHENERLAGERIGYVAYLSRLSLPPPESRYSFDYGAARFVCFNSDDFKNEEQMAWMVETLKKAREDSRVQWLIVYQHHPLYSSTVGRLNNGPLAAAVRDVLDRYNVDLVFGGHNHNYERSYPLTGETVRQPGRGPYRKGNGVVFVISGGGGKSLYRFTPERPAVTARRESVPHYMKVKVSKKQLEVQAIRTEDRSLLDSFAIRAGE